MNTVVIVGASAGIGLAAAKYIARHRDWHVVLACRNAERAKAAIQEIRKSDPKASVSSLLLDLFSLHSIENFAASIDGHNLPPLRGLVLNAGGINMKAKAPEFSEDGFDKIFQLNFFGHFVLTSLLLDKLLPPSRVVFVSSDLHDPAATKMGKFTPPRYGAVDDAAYGRGPYAKMSPMVRYGTAKMFMMMCAREFDRRLRVKNKSPGITVNSWSPGVVPTTLAGESMPWLQKKIMTSAPFVKFMGSHLSTLDEAAHGLGRLITDTGFEGISGRYFDGLKEIPSSAESRDESKARAVWEQARALAKMTGEEAAAS